MSAPPGSSPTMVTSGSRAGRRACERSSRSPETPRPRAAMTYWVSSVSGKRARIIRVESGRKKRANVSQGRIRGGAHVSGPPDGRGQLRGRGRDGLVCAALVLRRLDLGVVREGVRPARHEQAARRQRDQPEDRERDERDREEHEQAGEQSPDDVGRHQARPSGSIARRTDSPSRLKPRMLTKIPIDGKSVAQNAVWLFGAPPSGSAGPGWRSVP